MSSKKLGKIYADGRFYKKKHDGVSRYATEITVQLCKKYEVVAISNNKIIIPNELISEKNFKLLQFPLLNFIPGTIFISLFLPFFYIFSKCSFIGFCHTIPFFGFKNRLLVVHDIVAYKYPETMSFFGNLLTRLFFPLSLLSAKNIVSVSEFTSIELSSNFNIRSKIHVARNAVDKNVFYKQNHFNTNSQNINFILTVGTIEPRKNLFALISSYEEVVELELYSGDLYIVGASGWKNKKLHDYVKLSPYSDKIHFLGFLSDQDLNILYNKCDVFVSPSLYEGFSIPPVEAYCAGCKVIASKYSEIPYLNLSANMYIYDPKRNNLTNLILHVLNHKEEVIKDNGELNDLSWKNSSEIFFKLLS